MSQVQVSDGDEEPPLGEAEGGTYPGGNAAGVGDAARQRASGRAVVVHVD